MCKPALFLQVLLDKQASSEHRFWFPDLYPFKNMNHYSHKFKVSIIQTCILRPCFKHGDDHSINPCPAHPLCSHFLCNFVLGLPNLKTLKIICKWPHNTKLLAFPELWSHQVHAHTEWRVTSEHMTLHFPEICKNTLV